MTDPIKQHTCWNCSAKVPRLPEDIARGQANTDAVVRGEPVRGGMVAGQSMRAASGARGAALDIEATHRLERRQMNVPEMFAIGSSKWPGLSKLAEEAGEALQVIGKLMGTGGETAHWDGTDLRARLIDEVADVLAACDFVADANDLVLPIQARRKQKLALFHQWHGAPVAAPSPAVEREIVVGSTWSDLRDAHWTVTRVDGDDVDVERLGIALFWTPRGFLDNHRWLSDPQPAPPDARFLEYAREEYQVAPPSDPEARVHIEVGVTRPAIARRLSKESMPDVNMRENERPEPTDTGVIRAAEGVVLEAGAKYTIVSLGTDDRPDLSEGCTVIAVAQRSPWIELTPDRNDPDDNMCWYACGQGDGTWVTAVRRVQEQAPQAEAATGERSERSMHCLCPRSEPASDIPNHYGRAAVTAAPYASCTPEAIRDALLRNNIFDCVTRTGNAIWHYSHADELIAGYRAELTKERDEALAKLAELTERCLDLRVTATQALDQESGLRSKVAELTAANDVAGAELHRLIAELAELWRAVNGAPAEGEVTEPTGEDYGTCPKCHIRARTEGFATCDNCASPPGARS